MTILWDWNGTLVADVAHVVKMNNIVLEQFGYRHRRNTGPNSDIRCMNITMIWA